MKENLQEIYNNITQYSLNDINTLNEYLAVCELETTTPTLLGYDLYLNGIFYKDDILKLFDDFLPM